MAVKKYLHRATTRLAVILEAATGDRADAADTDGGPELYCHECRCWRGDVGPASTIPHCPVCGTELCENDA